MKNSIYMKEIFVKMKKNLIKKYSINISLYNKIKINQLIFNFESRYTAIFKEFLLKDDGNEFIKKFYHKNEIKKKLSKILSFYENYSKIFPNYIIISESKYMYKNIQQKQKMIDKLQKMKIEEMERKKENDLNETIFTNSAMNSICNHIDSFYARNLKNIIDISICKENTIEQFNKIIKNIEQYEKDEIIVKKKPPLYINLIANKKTKKYNNNFSTSLHKKKLIENNNIKSFRQSSINISTSINSDIFNKFNQNIYNLNSSKSPSICPMINNLQTNKKIIFHQKGNSQQISLNNTNNTLKNKILQLDNKNYYLFNDSKNKLYPFSLRIKVKKKFKDTISFLSNSTRPIFDLNKNKIKKKLLSPSNRNNINISEKEIRINNKFQSLSPNKHLIITPKKNKKEIIGYNIKKIQLGDEKLKLKLNKNIHFFKINNN